jgi:hypothetical protein
MKCSVGRVKGILNIVLGFKKGGVKGGLDIVEISEPLGLCNPTNRK